MLARSWPRNLVWKPALGLLLFFPFSVALAGQDQAREDLVVIGVAGDVLPESRWLGAPDAAHMLDGVREEFARADLVFVNLEEPITLADTVTPFKSRAAIAAGRDYILRARNPAIPRLLRSAGVGLVGLANNHMLDYTERGLRDTLAAFAEAGLPTVGAGLKSSAERPYTYEKGRIRVALLAFSDVVPTNYEATGKRQGIASSRDEAELLQAIQRARRQANFVVLMIHWGGQGRRLITRRQRTLGRTAAEAGCDAVVGMHPHVLQGIEYVGKVPVFYSLGNFAFPSKRVEARESVLLRLSFDERSLASAELTPIEISSQGVPQVARGNEVLTRLDHLCRMFNTRVEATGVLSRAPVRARLVYDESGVRSLRSARRSRRASGRSGR